MMRVGERIGDCRAGWLGRVVALYDEDLREAYAELDRPTAALVVLEAGSATLPAGTRLMLDIGGRDMPVHRFH